MAEDNSNNRYAPDDGINLRVESGSCSPNPCNRATSLHRLAMSLVAKSKQSRDGALITKAILLYREALELSPLGDPSRDIFLESLALALNDHFEFDNDWHLLVEAVELYQQVLGLRPVGHPLRNISVERFVAVYQHLLAQFENNHKRQEIIQYYKRALAETNSTDLHRDVPLYYLAMALWLQSRSAGDESLLTDAIRLHREALQLRPIGNPLRDFSLNGLALAIVDQWMLHSGDNLLEEAAYLYQEALELRPSGHPLRIISLLNLNTVVSYQYEKDGDGYKLEATVKASREALKLCPPGHPLRDMAAMCLAVDLVTLFRRYGQQNDLAESIQLNREVLEICSPDHPRRAMNLDNLAINLRIQFTRFGEDDKLEEAIFLNREALRLHPPGHLLRIYSLSYLSLALLDKFELLGGEESLLEAICSLQEALKICPSGHHNRWLLLISLARALALNRSSNEYQEQLLTAKKLYEEALDLHPLGSPSYDDCLYGQGRVFYASYEAFANQEDFPEALRLYHKALKYQQMGHPNRAKTHHAIAEALLRAPPEEKNWESAFQHIAQANTDPFCPARQRLQWASKIIEKIERVIVSDRIGSTKRIVPHVLEVYIQAVELIPQAAHLGMDLPSRLRELSGTESLCRTVAVRALFLDKPSIAVEVLEEGRAVFWTQALRLRTTGLLGTLPDDKRERLEPLLHVLEQRSHVAIGSNESRAILERRIEEQRQLNSDVEAIVRDIRSAPGLERFMRIQSYEKLSEAATGGIVVVLLSTDLASFALIIMGTTGASIAVPLNSITPSYLKKLRFYAHSTGLRDCGTASNTDDRLGMQKHLGNHISPFLSSHLVLEQIWRMIVSPVITQLSLKRSSGYCRPRLYWCPVGDFMFLPLHAAGIYTGPDQVCASDFVVSSYTPSLSALIKARRYFVPIKLESISALLVSERGGLGYAPLLKAEEEVCSISMLMKNASIKHELTTAPMKHKVIEFLPSVNLLHLSCHGIQRERALESHFILHDGTLTIAELTKLELPNAVFAFLSACETAKGDQSQPDQAIHLAASLLFCGFRTVIGTMWTMHDEDGPGIAKSVYAELFRKETFDLDTIPYALDAAVRGLREGGALPSRWATFVHIGA